MNKTWDQMTWEQARQQGLFAAIESNPEMSDFIYACDSIAKDLGKDASVYVVEYKYGDKILNGSGFSPSELLTEIGLEPLSVPLGLVIQNQAEVVEHTAGLAESREIIAPGEFFGAFETANRIGDLFETGVRPWELTAGATSAVFVFSSPSKNQPIRRQLGRLDFKVGIDYPELMVELATNEEKLIKLVESEQINVSENRRKSWRFDWRCRVLIFPKQWESSSGNFREAVLKQAWRQASAQLQREGLHRKMLSLLDDQLKLPLETVKKKFTKDAVAKILAKLENSTNGISTALAGASEGDGTAYGAGPFGEILGRFEDVISKSTLDRIGGNSRTVRPRILVPRKLGLGETGLLKIPMLNLTVGETTEIAKMIKENLDSLNQFIPTVDWKEVRLISKNNAQIKRTEGDFHLPENEVERKLFSLGDNANMFLGHPVFKGSVLIKRSTK